MILATLQRWALVAGLAALVCGGFWWHGWDTRGDREAARTAVNLARAQRDLQSVADDLSEREFALRQEEAALSIRAEEHEDAVRANADACLELDADQLRRLRARWAVSPAAPD